ncbi:hypothetical protein CHS0354_040707 [Potamilus streckersoni]|uniref:Uncharacterized protein n=1 Tax=Potamilus streckersoni TaxID=2493646 RepID=A0AAE0VXT6_9BIVA|nr:hypothetical protein CHS0354_040707 [Potamilus streckersoni]
MPVIIGLIQQMLKKYLPFVNVFCSEAEDSGISTRKIAIMDAQKEDSQKRGIKHVKSEIGKFKSAVEKVQNYACRLDKACVI